MPIPFTCPHCGEQTLVADRYAGHEGPCVNCGRTTKVPGDPSQIPSDIVQPRPAANAARKRSKAALMAVAILAFAASILVIGLLLAGPAIQATRSVTTRRRCAANLRQLALAIDAYERDFGSYPPAVTLGVDGTPWHSWRVLILPYLGPQQRQLYSQYDMNQPWDSPTNMRLLSSMPQVFASPADLAAQDRYETSYVAVVGPGLAFPGWTSANSSQLVDGLDGTVLLVEVRGSGTAWLEPRDLDGRSIAYLIGTDLGGNHAGGANAVTADGQSHFLSDSLSPQEMRALLTIAGGEGVSVDAK